MAEDSFLEKDVSERFADCHHIHVWQGLLGVEAAGVHVLRCGEPVHRADDLDDAVWLDQEGDARAGHLVAEAGWRCFDDTTHSAE